MISIALLVTGSSAFFTAALRELFRTKLGNHTASDFSSGELMRERRLNQHGADLKVEVQTRLENGKSKEEAEEEEMVKTPSEHASLMGLNESTDEFFDVSEPLDYDQTENSWSSDFSPDTYCQVVLSHKVLVFFKEKDLENVDF